MDSWELPTVSTLGDGGDGGNGVGREIENDCEIYENLHSNKLYRSQQDYRNDLQREKDSPERKKD
jgi:hypothetical protein